MSPAAPDTWKILLRDAFDLFDDLDGRGFGAAPFSLGGGTVLMLRFRHRLSKDIDLFGYDAQWLSLLSPRLNDRAAALATSYAEQANKIKIVTARGDIAFIIAGDVTSPVLRERAVIEGRAIDLEPTAEILSKKLYYRAAGFTARDVYDMSAAIDLDRPAASAAARAAESKRALLVRRLDEMDGLAAEPLLDTIVPYERPLRHAKGMLAKVRGFLEDPGP